MDILKKEAINIRLEVDHAVFPIETTPKGIETFTIDMDDIELIETGSKEKNGKVVQFYKFRIIKPQ
jgi:hypothetical protein